MPISQYRFPHSQMLTTESRATVSERGFCCCSAVQAPHSTTLGTTVPPRWSTGTYRETPHEGIMKALHLQSVGHKAFIIYCNECTVVFENKLINN